MPVATTATSCDMVREAQQASATGRAQAAASRREHALDVLTAEFNQLHAAVYRYLLHRFFDPELAEELTAQTFYQAATFIGRLGGDVRHLRVWLLRTATNLANTHYRRTRWRQFVLRRLAKAKPLTTESESAPNSIDGQRRARVRGALLALRPKYQTVVVLRYYAQMSFGEIAAVVGCRQDAVRARLSRALQELRERLGISSIPDSLKASE